MQLSHPQADGLPLRAHLQVEARVTGQPSPLLSARPPAACAALWVAYCELNAEGEGGIQGPHIEAWQRLSGVSLTTWEVDTLRAVDHAVEAASKARRQETKQ